MKIRFGKNKKDKVDKEDTELKETIQRENSGKDENEPIINEDSGEKGNFSETIEGEGAFSFTYYFRIEHRGKITDPSLPITVKADTEDDALTRAVDAAVKNCPDDHTAHYIGMFIKHS